MRNFSSWIIRHIKDQYVKNSIQEGFRARSAFKLQQIFDKFPQIRTSIQNDNSITVDLGSAPGSWSQILALYSPPKSKIVALDLLPMLPLERVQFINLDFTSDEAFPILKCLLKDENRDKNVNLIVSDMCANLSGNSWIDNQKNLLLWETALEFSLLYLSEKGHLVLKYFESQEAKMFRKKLEANFEKVTMFKPKASRQESSEKYFICSYKINKSLNNV